MESLSKAEIHFDPTRYVDICWFVHKQYKMNRVSIFLYFSVNLFLEHLLVISDRFLENILLIVQTGKNLPYRPLQLLLLSCNFPFLPHLLTRITSDNLRILLRFSLNPLSLIGLVKRRPLLPVLPDEGMPQQLPHIKSPLRIQHYHLPYKLIRLSWYLWIYIQLEVVPVLHKGLIIEVFPRKEWYVLVQHLVNDNSQWPNIHFVVVIVPACNFRSHVAKVTQIGGPPSHLINKTKINNFDLVLPRHHYILWREIAMNVAVLVYDLQPLKNLICQKANLPFL